MQAITGVENSLEQFLCDKASVMGTPIGANLELLPVCNMDCQMCYVRTDWKEVNRRGGLPDSEMWMRLGREMKAMDTLFVLLTGGEPLLYRDFRKVYRYYHELGFILTVNTNGTLLDEDWADFFAEVRPRRMNLTIYGKDNETYERLCGNPRGFDQLSRAVSLLKERGIPMKLNCSLTRTNADQWEDLRRIAREWEVPLDAAYYMMPPARKIHGSSPEEDPQAESRSAALRERHNSSRLLPADAAEAAWKILTEKMTEDEKRTYIEGRLQAVKEFVPDRVYRPGFRCRAGNASFWVKWDGSVTACGMLPDQEFSIRREELASIWEKLKARTREVCLSEKCTNCRLQDLCPKCAAAEYTENDGFGREPEYLCRFAEAYEQILKRKASAYGIVF